ncbi:hypothetical protein H4Q26_011779 [Puccinia striiformis f. sp. tritici PST-130]|nr:hypothetical protein H4Q26_011779 [Puccinia striiformis f. sp. tritici PST-130]
MASLSNISPFSGEASILGDRALKLPLYTKLTGNGINPEVIPSSFEENLDHSSFEDPESPETKGLRYAAATASEKAIDVYTRLVAASPENPPDLVIGADTVLQTFFPGPGELPKILEKPNSPADQLSSPGYTVKTIGNPVDYGLGTSVEKAFVSQGEGIDRAGGISVKVLAHSYSRIDGTGTMSCVGFPAFAFVQFLKKVMADDSDFLDD